MAKTEITTANPGNRVVPLSAIIDQLQAQGKLSKSEIDALLYAVISQQKTEVRPGDLITSALINQILNSLTDLEVRVAQIEATGSSVSTLKISKILPAVLRMGEELKVFGTGLSSIRLKQMSIEGSSVQLSLIKTGSTDQLMIFDIPPILGIPNDGKTVVLTIEDKTGVSDFGSFFLLPGIAINLEASFKITRTTVSPSGKLAINTDYDVTFSIEAFTSRDENYLLDPKVIGAPSDWTVAMKGGKTEILIPKSQPTPSTTSVVVTLHTGASATGTGQLTLGLKSKNFIGVSGSSMAEKVAINEEPGTPNLDVEFLSPVVAGSVQKFTNGSLYIRKDVVAGNQFARIIPLNVRVKQPGKYTIGAPVVSNGNWTVTVTNNPLFFDTSGQPNAIRGIDMEIRAAASAPDATVEIPLTGEGSLPDGSYKFSVKLRDDPSNPNPL